MSDGDDARRDEGRDDEYPSMTPAPTAVAREEPTAVGRAAAEGSLARGRPASAGPASAGARAGEGEENRPTRSEEQRRREEDEWRAREREQYDEARRRHDDDLTGRVDRRDGGMATLYATSTPTGATEPPRDSFGLRDLQHDGGRRTGVRFDTPYWMAGRRHARDPDTSDD